MRTLFSLFFALGLSLSLTSCQSGEEDHAHGPDTHTHDDAPAAKADTAGTYVDSTSTLFDEAEAAATDDDHEHGEDSHTH